LTLAVTTFGTLSAGAQERLHEEALQVAALQGAAGVRVSLDAG